MDPTFLNINRHGVLRVPGVLWMAFAVMARHWILVLLVAVSARREQSAVLLLGDTRVLWLMLVLQAPVVLLAVVGFRREPEAGRWARRLWRHGREIVALTAVLNLGWTANLLLESDYWTPWPELFLASCTLIDAAIAISMYTTPYYRQLFQEFPALPLAQPLKP